MKRPLLKTKKWNLEQKCWEQYCGDRRKEQRNKKMNGQMSERMNEQMNERTNRQMNRRMNVIITSPVFIPVT